MAKKANPEAHTVTMIHIFPSENKSFLEDWSPWGPLYLNPVIFFFVEMWWKKTDLFRTGLSWFWFFSSLCLYQKDKGQNRQRFYWQHYYDLIDILYDWELARDWNQQEKASGGDPYSLALEQSP